MHPAGEGKGSTANGSNGSEPEKFCGCDELVLNGKRLPCPPHHDCDYTRRRSELVEIAVANVTKRIPFEPYRNGEKFTRAFAAEMEKVSRPLLLQSSNGHRAELQSGYKWPC